MQSVLLEVGTDGFYNVKLEKANGFDEFLCSSFRTEMQNIYLKYSVLPAIAKCLYDPGRI